MIQVWLTPLSPSLTPLLFSQCIYAHVHKHTHTHTLIPGGHSLLLFTLLLKHMPGTVLLEDRQCLVQVVSARYARRESMVSSLPWVHPSLLNSIPLPIYHPWEQNSSCPSLNFHSTLSLTCTYGCHAPSWSVCVSDPLPRVSTDGISNVLLIFVSPRPHRIHPE